MIARHVFDRGKAIMIWMRAHGIEMLAIGREPRTRQVRRTL